ncbi:STIM2 family protein [Megaselia abdita]
MNVNRIREFISSIILFVFFFLLLRVDGLGSAPGDTVVITSGGRMIAQRAGSLGVIGGGPGPQIHHNNPPVSHQQHIHQHHHDHRNSYSLLSEAMKQAVNHEFSSSADGACHVDDLECFNEDRLGMEAIRSLHRQLDDDDNGNIDLSESDDFLREELKYDSGYEKRQKAFHFNDDMHISVKELWEAWLRSEVHNWTIEQTTDWLAQSVQLPQYVDLFKKNQVSGAALPRLAVNNMHYVSNVLGIKDPIHKQKIALKAMDVVLFGPPRETGHRWKDYILVTLLLSAIIGCWYAYQQNKNAKRHLRRMAKDMEGLQRAEQSLSEMQKELERARIEQENVATEKQDLERRLKEAPSLSASSSDLELQQLKQEIEMLRTELSRAEVELVDHCWSPPPQLQNWLQYTYELESKNHAKKRLFAEKQLLIAREACEKLRKKRTSLVGAFTTTHGKSIDDVDRSIVDARTSLAEVTNELQERLHRWKQIEMLLGVSIVNNHGLSYLENILYNRSNGSVKSSRARMTSSTEDMDDESVQGRQQDYYNGQMRRGDDSSNNSEDGVDSQSVHFYLGGGSGTQTQTSNNSNNNTPVNATVSKYSVKKDVTPVNHHPSVSSSSAVTPSTYSHPHQSHQASHNNSHPYQQHQQSHVIGPHDSIQNQTRQDSPSSECSAPLPPRSKKPNITDQCYSSTPSLPQISSASSHQTPVPPPRVPIPPPRRSNQSRMVRSFSAELGVKQRGISTTTNNFFLPTITNDDHHLVLSPQPLSMTTTTTTTMSKTTSSNSVANVDDANSTDSTTDDDKKHKKKLRFPFKKSSKSKIT